MNKSRRVKGSLVVDSGYLLSNRSIGVVNRLSVGKVNSFQCSENLYRSTWWRSLSRWSNRVWRGVFGTSGCAVRRISTGWERSSETYYIWGQQGISLFEWEVDRAMLEYEVWYRMTVKCRHWIKRLDESYGEMKRTYLTGCLTCFHHFSLTSPLQVTSSHHSYLK